MTNPIHIAQTGLAASTFCLGTIGWGTKTRADDLDRLYDTFRESGQNFFDTAHVYAFWLPSGSGASERALGEIVRRRNDRDRVILATKGGHPNMDGGYPRPQRYLSPEVVAQDIDESLDRLGVDAIDLYFLHRDDPRVPVGEIIDLLNEHVRAGRIREIGASNWTTSRIELANAYAATNGRRGFVANQAKFSLAVAEPSKDPTVPPFGQDEIAWHARSAMPVCAYSPTANGFFATIGVKGAGGWKNPTSTSRLLIANRIAAEVGATPNQVALAWLLHQSFQVIPILGTAQLEHLTDALNAGHVQLTPQHLSAFLMEHLQIQN